MVSLVCAHTSSWSHGLPECISYEVSIISIKYHNHILMIF